MAVVVYLIGFFLLANSPCSLQKVDITLVRSKPRVTDLSRQRRPPIANSSSEEAFLLLRKWLGSCVETQSQCRQGVAGKILENGEEPLLPKRVIDVGPDDGSDSPRLLEAKGLRGNFVALSHRWGSLEKMPLRTTIESLPKSPDRP